MPELEYKYHLIADVWKEHMPGPIDDVDWFLWAKSRKQAENIIKFRLREAFGDLVYRRDKLLKVVETREIVVPTPDRQMSLFPA